jgi:hypothetical protein
MPFQMKVWSIAINDATGSLKVPPEVLVKSFKPARDTQANPMRDNGQKSSFSSNSVATSTPALSVTPMQYPVHQMMHQPYPYPYGLPAPYTQLRDTLSRRNDVRSSSIISGSDGVEKLVRYIVWLAQKNPTLATTLFEAKKTLIERDFSFETMEHVTDVEFLQMGIS